MPASNPDASYNALAFMFAATVHYLRTGDDADVTQIAELLGWSVSKVRKIVAQENGCPGSPGADFIRCRQETRTSYSKSYRGFESGSHKAWVYGPTRDTLRAMLMG